MKNPWIAAAKSLIKLYTEGSDLTDEQTHVLYDTAAEHGQILENVAHTAWFRIALAENMWALSNTP